MAPGEAPATAPAASHPLVEVEPLAPHRGARRFDHRFDHRLDHHFEHRFEHRFDDARRGERRGEGEGEDGFFLRDSFEEEPLHGAGGPLHGCSPAEVSDARARADGEHYITLRLGVTVPVAVRAETIHAIKATATLDDVSRALERDDAFAAVWPGRLARRDFKPVEGSEVVTAPANAKKPESETAVSTARTALDADGAEEMSEEALAARIKAALEERRMEALRLATEVEGDTRTTSSGRSWQHTAALGAAAGGSPSEKRAGTGSGWFFAAAGAALAAAAAAATIAARFGRDGGTAAERVPLTGVGATATVY
jgi:hypothetical protein